jgi:hypothetical protein
MNAYDGAQNLVEQEGRRVHDDVPRIRLGPRTRGFKRDLLTPARTKKEAVACETASQKKVECDYFAAFTCALGIAVSFARIVSVCSASPRSSSLYF